MSCLVLGFRAGWKLTLEQIHAWLFRLRNVGEALPLIACLFILSYAV